CVVSVQPASSSAATRLVCRDISLLQHGRVRGTHVGRVNSEPGFAKREAAQMRSEVCCAKSVRGGAPRSKRRGDGWEVALGAASTSGSGGAAASWTASAARPAAGGACSGPIWMVGQQGGFVRPSCAQQ